MDLVQVIILGTIAMLLPVGAIIVFVMMYYRKQRLQKENFDRLEEEYKQSLLVASIVSQESVRRQIGGDLHDDIGTLLSATRMSLSQIAKHVDNENKRTFLLNQTQELLNEALNNVRRISKELMPSTLDEFGLIEALKDFSQKMTSHASMPITFHYSTGEKRYDKKLELPLYRSAQELVNNALKHAQATMIDLDLSEINGSLILEVQDNGIGFDLEEVNKPDRGIGLKNIESRLSVINGRIIIDVAKGKGSRFVITVPTN
jgi:signal transduction histidine kinase